MKKIWRVFVAVILFIVAVGFVFPVIMSGIANLLFPFQAQGSLVVEDTIVKGSYLIGQNFTKNDELRGRPSANDYSLNISGSSNLSVFSNSYKLITADRIAIIQANHPTMIDKKVPVDLVTESASGLDPHISVESAMYQIDRIVKHTDLDFETIKSVISKGTKDNRENVLEVNMELKSLRVGK